MSKRKQVLILTIIAAVAAAGVVIAINPFGGSSAQANQGARSGVQRWEYCAINGAYSTGDRFIQRGAAYIRYFQTGGAKEETVEFVPDIGGRNMGYVEEALAKAMAKLGNEGWEMVSKEPDRDSTGTTNYIFYFKRPKQ